MSSTNTTRRSRTASPTITNWSRITASRLLTPNPANATVGDTLTNTDALGAN